MMADPVPATATVPSARSVWIGGVALLGAAAAIWLRDTNWRQFPADTLPLIAGLPLVAFLGGPWHPASHPRPPRLLLLLGGMLLFAAGWVTTMTTLMAAGWCLLLAAWMDQAFEPLARRGRLAWIGLLSFPWLALDWPGIGWAFRLSAAKIVTTIFSWLALPVTREGTSFEVIGMPVEVQQACAGWNLLQLSLLTGLAMATMELRRPSRFALLLILMPLIAWFANVIRILILAVVGLSWGVDVASGSLHMATGLVVLVVVLFSTRFLSSLLERRQIVRTEV